MTKAEMIERLREELAEARRIKAQEQRGGRISQNFDNALHTAGVCEGLRMALDIIEGKYDQT